MSNHHDSLELAYAAVAVMRQQGKKYGRRPVDINAASIERLSGVKRQTFYGTHPDWTEFRDVIEHDKPHPRITEANKELRTREKWEIELDGQATRIEQIESSINEVRSLADTAYKQLLGQLHRYVALSAQAPDRQNKTGELIKENQRLAAELLATKEQIVTLRSQAQESAQLLPMTRKKEIVINSHVPRNEWTAAVVSDAIIDAVNALDEFFGNASEASQPQTVYVLSGNMASGKSSWVTRHKPTNPGISLYIDGPCNTVVSRKTFLRRVKKLSPHCRVVCVRVLADLRTCITHNQAETRVRFKEAVPEQLIREMDAAFEEVSITEGFDAIEIVSA